MGDDVVELPGDARALLPHRLRRLTRAAHLEVGELHVPA
jgi:hypothetical protein